MFSTKKGFPFLKDIGRALKKFCLSSSYKIGARASKNSYIAYGNQGLAQFFIKLISLFPWRRLLRFGPQWANPIRQ